MTSNETDYCQKWLRNATTGNKWALLQFELELAGKGFANINPASPMSKAGSSPAKPRTGGSHPLLGGCVMQHMTRTR